uniref:Uncharacterized protein n=1 Tax=Panagrellus redivivus TaxID=6233 RepID=A0A7E4UPK8_PANRE
MVISGLQKRLPLESAVRTPSEAAKCSEGEHPILGIGFYYVDPCRINAATKDMEKTANPILRWFSVAVQSTRLRSPIELFVNLSN